MSYWPVTISLFLSTIIDSNSCPHFLLFLSLHTPCGLSPFGLSSPPPLFTLFLPICTSPATISLLLYNGLNRLLDFRPDPSHSLAPSQRSGTACCFHCHSLQYFSYQTTTPPFIFLLRSPFQTKQSLLFAFFLMPQLPPLLFRENNSFVGFPIVLQPSTHYNLSTSPIPSLSSLIYQPSLLYIDRPQLFH